jgi:hypothetical protein
MPRYGFVLRVSDSVPLHSRNTVSVVMTPETAPATCVDVPLLGGSCWWFVGPFRNLTDEGYDRAFEPEDKPGLDNTYLSRDGGLVRWQRMAFGESVMPLESLFNGVPGVAYGLTTLHQASSTLARIAAFSNDGVRLWLNGQRVLQRHSHELFRPNLARQGAGVDVTLRPGDNPLMLKIVRCGRPIQFALAVTDREDRPLIDLGNTRW